MGVLQDRAIIITGAGRGLGRGYALACAAAGARVIVNDVDVELAEAVAAKCRAGGGEAHASGHAVDDAAQAEALVELAMERFGRLDGLVNNAGLFHLCDPGEEDAARARRVIEVNLLGTLFCGMAAIRRMQAAGRGVIVNVTSGAAVGRRRMSTYGASKGGVLSLTANWALDLQGSGVRVNAVSPVAATRMFELAVPGRAGAAEPEEIAPLVVYLLSDAAAHLHGRTLRLAAGELSMVAPPVEGPVLARREAWDFEALEAALRG